MKFKNTKTGAVIETECETGKPLRQKREKERKPTLKRMLALKRVPKPEMKRAALKRAPAKTIRSRTWQTLQL